MEWIDIDESLQKIQESVYGRLIAWATEKEETKEEEKKVMQYSQTVVRQFCENGAGDAIENGWQCGLGRMLDLREEVVCKAVPYMLTAYMYNYGLPRKGFVRAFVKDRTEHGEGTDFSQDELFGISKLEKEAKQLGIGNLLRGKYIDPNPKVGAGAGGSYKTPLLHLSKLFSFSGVELYWATGQNVAYPFEPQKYIIPKGYGGLNNLKAAQKDRCLIEIPEEKIKSRKAAEDEGKTGRIYYTQKFSIDSITISIIEEELDFFNAQMDKTEDKTDIRRLKEGFRNLYAEFLYIKEGIGTLKARVENLENDFDKCIRDYHLTNRSEKKARQFSSEMRYESILNIFAGWYHFWKEAEKKPKGSWHPEYRVDPVLCVLLLKRTLYPVEEAANFEKMIKEIGEKAYEYVDEIIEGQFTDGMFANPSLFDLLEMHQ